MPKFFGRRVALLLAGIMLLAIGYVLGQQTATSEKTLLHVFAYTPLEGATPQDFDNFNKATSDLLGKVPGLKRVWVGRLKAPFDAQEGKRVYGVGMEFENAKALAAYADDPAHKDWEKIYRKVRVAGTTTFDILGGDSSAPDLSNPGPAEGAAK
jgi:hypothetical protein